MYLIPFDSVTRTVTHIFCAVYRGCPSKSRLSAFSVIAYKKSNSAAAAATYKVRICHKVRAYRICFVHQNRTFVSIYYHIIYIKVKSSKFCKILFTRPKSLKTATFFYHKTTHFQAFFGISQRSRSFVYKLQVILIYFLRSEHHGDFIILVVISAFYRDFLQHINRPCLS